MPCHRWPTQNQPNSIKDFFSHNGLSVLLIFFNFTGLLRVHCGFCFHRSSVCVNVYLCICVCSLCFSLAFFFLFYLYVCFVLFWLVCFGFSVWLFSNKRKKGVSFGGWRGRQDLEGVGEGEPWSKCIIWKKSFSTKKEREKQVSPTSLVSNR